MATPSPDLDRGLARSPASGSGGSVPDGRGHGGHGEGPRLSAVPAWGVVGTSVVLPVWLHERIDAVQRGRSTELRLENVLWGLGGETVAAWLGVVQALRGLTHLSLEGNGLGPRHAAVLADTLKAHTLLRSLDLGSNALGPVGALAVSRALQGLTQLEWLRLSDNGFGASGASEFASALSKLTRLKKLR